MNCVEVFEHYYGLMSEEFRMSIKKYEKLPMTIPLPASAVREGAIKVLFSNGSWIRVYQLEDGRVQWY